jgi:ribosomal 30S subunit maturation factor RimM
MNLEENIILGRINNISNFGAGDILEISNDRTEYLVPLLSNDIQNINLDKKFIRLSNIDKWININD